MQLDDSRITNLPHIKVVGVGSCGIDVINRMLNYGLRGLDFITIDTDAQALLTSLAPNRIQIGEKLTKGFGTNYYPEIAQQAANDAIEEIDDALKGADIVFIIAGLGGGTGTGAAPIIASCARQKSALTVAIVTTPFSMVNTKHAQIAKVGIEELKQNVDSIITIPCDNIIELMEKRTPTQEAFRIIDELISQSVLGITDPLFSLDEVICLDFADLRFILLDSGLAVISCGHAVGEDAPINAAKEAMDFPGMKEGIKDARAILLNISGKSLGIVEVHEVTEFIRQFTQPDADIVCGLTEDDFTEDDVVSVTVLATKLKNNR